MTNMDESIKTILEIVTEIQEDVSGIRDRMATKEALQAVHLDLQAQINAHTRTIEANTKAIADLSEQLRSVLGYAKEIDLLMDRVSAIEKHIGIAVHMAQN